MAQEEHVMNAKQFMHALEALGNHVKKLTEHTDCDEMLFPEPFSLRSHKTDKFEVIGLEVTAIEVDLDYQLYDHHSVIVTLEELDLILSQHSGDYETKDSQRSITMPISAETKQPIADLEEENQELNKKHEVTDARIAELERELDKLSDEVQTLYEEKAGEDI